MNSYSLPLRATSIVFDLDNTLYHHPAYVAFQTDALVARLAEDRGLSVGAASALVEETREFLRQHSGRRPSLAATFVELGIDIQTSVRWRSELFEPAEFLRPDLRLQELLTRIESVPLGVVSNNPVPVVRKTLRVLQVELSFGCIVGLDSCMEPKPSHCGFDAFFSWSGTGYAECIVVGDRYDVDLEPVLARGGGGILIEQKEDLYRAFDLLIPLISDADADPGSGENRG